MKRMKALKMKELKEKMERIAKEGGLVVQDDGAPISSFSELS